jgi:hypothetical protein
VSLSLPLSTLVENTLQYPYVIYSDETILGLTSACSTAFLWISTWLVILILPVLIKRKWEGIFEKRDLSSSQG